LYSRSTTSGRLESIASPDLNSLGSNRWLRGGFTLRKAQGQLGMEAIRVGGSMNPASPPAI
jgi:hypothetical protein